MYQYVFDLFLLVCHLVSCAQDLLDINADSSKVRLLLGGIKVSIDELQAQVHAYTSYQKQPGQLIPTSLFNF